MRPMSAQHIIWDWNGTLLDDVDACVQSVNCMLKPRNLPLLSTDHYREIFDFPVQAYYRTLGFDMALEDWDRVAEEFHAHYAHFSGTSPLRPYVKEVLSALAATGHTFSILSASEEQILHRMLEARGIWDAFEHIHGLDNLHAASKVDRGHALLDALSPNIDEIVLIGDTLHDHDVARELGCDCILLAGGHNSERRLRTAGRPVITNLEALPHMLHP